MITLIMMFLMVVRTTIISIATILDLHEQRSRVIDSTPHPLPRTYRNGKRRADGMPRGVHPQRPMSGRRLREVGRSVLLLVIHSDVVVDVVAVVNVHTHD